MDALKNTLEIREHLQTGLALNDSELNLEGRRVNAVLVNDLGQESVIGTTLGAPEGKTTFLGVAFDVDPGTYRLELRRPNGPFLFPKGNERARINVYNIQTDN